MVDFVLVHGAGHGGWCWSEVARILRQEGHGVVTPTLTGLGERSHLLSSAVNLSMHIEDISNVLVYEDMRDIVLVGHSYAGAVIAGVVDAQPERVGGLVYLDATIVRHGEAIIDASPGLAQLTENDGIYIDGVETVLSPGPIARYIYGIDDDDMWNAMVPRLSPHPVNCFHEKLNLRDPDILDRTPTWRINCTRSIAGRPAEIVDRWTAGDNVVEVDAAHDLMLTDPELTARLLLETLDD